MKKRVVLIVQARMGSTRLPGKSMMELAGQPLIVRILERIKRCSCLDEIVLAIPDTKENDVLGDIGKKLGITVFAGSENDLLERYYKAAIQSNAYYVGRLPADNPCPEPSEIDRIVEFHRNRSSEGFSSNLAEIYESGYPDGIGAEVFDVSLLDDAQGKTPSEEQREHVHLNFYDYATGRPVDDVWCPVSTIPCPIEFRRPDLVLDVNTLTQYEYMKELYNDIYPNKPNFHITDVIRWHDRKYSKKPSGN